MSDEARSWSLPAPVNPAVRGSAAARHHALAGHRPTRHDGVALGDLLGPLAAPERRQVRNWSQGAGGERLTGQVLAPLAHLGWAVLHDRRLPGSANIDHLLVGPSHVWVVDSKAYQGRIKVLGDGHLWYGTTCLDDVLGVVRWAAGRVGEALQVQVAAALCIHGARLPRDPLYWNGVVLSGPAALLPLLTTGTPLSHQEAVGEVAAAAATAFPAASAQRQGGCL